MNREQAENILEAYINMECGGGDNKARASLREVILDAMTEYRSKPTWNTRHKSVFVTGTTIATDGEPVTYAPTRTCHIVKTWSDSDYVDDWRYRCSECRCFIPVNERDPETGDVISAANYCPNCGAKVVIA